MQRVSRRDDSSTVGIGLAVLAVGLVAGFAVGTYLADRFGGMGGISARVQGRVRSNRGRGGLRAPDDQDEARGESADETDTTFDDDYEEQAEWVSARSAAEGTGWSSGSEGDDDETEGFISADPELEDRVLSAFTNDPVLCERAIDIGAISPSTIELNGTVYTDEEYEHATVVARGVPGVETVVNRLTIREDEASKEQAARRYTDGDPRYTESRWENERVGTGRPRQGTSQDVGRHATPKVPLESRSLDEAEAVRDAADDIPPAPPTRSQAGPPRGDHRPPGEELGGP